MGLVWKLADWGVGERLEYEGEAVSPQSPHWQQVVSILTHCFTFVPVSINLRMTACKACELSQKEEGGAEAMLCNFFLLFLDSL